MDSKLLGLVGIGFAVGFLLSVQQDPAHACSCSWGRFYDVNLISVDGPVVNSTELERWPNETTIFGANSQFDFHGDQTFRFERDQ